MEAEPAVQPAGERQVPGHAERADGVPDPEVAEAERAARRQPAARAPRRLDRAGRDVRGVRGAEGERGGAVRPGLGRPGAVERERGGDRGGVAALEDAAVADQPGERARGEGAAREAEEVDLVPGRVGEDEEAVGVLDRRRSAPRRRRRRGPGRGAARAVRCRARCRRRRGGRRPARTPSGPAGARPGRAWRRWSGQRRVEPAPGAVAGDDDAFHAVRAPDRRAGAGPSAGRSSGVAREWEASEPSRKSLGRASGRRGMGRDGKDLRRSETSGRIWKPVARDSLNPASGQSARRARSAAPIVPSSR